MTLYANQTLARPSGKMPSLDTAVMPRSGSSSYDQEIRRSSVPGMRSDLRSVLENLDHERDLLQILRDVSHGCSLTSPTGHGMEPIRTVRRAVFYMTARRSRARVYRDLDDDHGSGHHLFSDGAGSAGFALADQPRCIDLISGTRNRRYHDPTCSLRFVRARARRSPCPEVALRVRDSRRSRSPPSDTTARRAFTSHPIGRLPCSQEVWTFAKASP